ncbi:carbonic anhydrase [Microbulbifer sp. TRSA002]|uniref:carbonic anhydrase n=1 Tax=Microbulbifer sp. TRSA002 TaxID=3243382 RepID=UPI004039466E
MMNNTTGQTPSRRQFLKTAGMAAVGLSLMYSRWVSAVPKPQNVMSSNAALKRLMEGNERYVAGKSTLHDFESKREKLVYDQNPFAAILSCSDSRIAPEYAFDITRGGLFVVRLAGNIASIDAIASLEFAVSVLNTPLIMVLGHQNCGAISGSISNIQKGLTLPGHIPHLVEEISPAVGLALSEKGKDKLLDRSVQENVRLNVAALKASPPVLGKLYTEKAIDVVGGIYNLETGRVDLLN